jgi:diguanylate cyclase (GGDEF)-like protein
MTGSLLSSIKRTTQLPSPPGTALQILQLCQQKDVEIKELADTLAADPALSARVLKYANSSLMGVRREVTSVRDAVVLLGIRSVRMMALSFSLISADDRRACRGFDYGRFWSHSVARGIAARYLAKRNSQAAPEEAFAAGVLAQLGKLVFAVTMPDSYADVLSAAAGRLGETSAYEPERMGTSHEELGADLLIDWQIPTELAEAIRCQNCPDQLAHDPPARQLALLVGISTAIGDIVCGTVRQELLGLRWKTLLASGFFDTQEQAAEAVDQIREEFYELSSLLSLQQGLAENAKEIQTEAGAILGELSLAAQLKTEAVEKENRGLRAKAWTDGLTGINNRAAFDKRLVELWKQAAENQRAIGLIMLDVDHFRMFNDRSGHQAGDAMLKAVAGCLPRVVRSVDFVARCGGEEFAVITPNVDRLTAAQICVKARKAVEALVVEFGGRQHHVTVSVGAAILPVSGPPFTPQKLIEATEAQLHCSKQKGRNCCSMKQLRPASADHAKPQLAPV